MVCYRQIMIKIVASYVALISSLLISVTQWRSRRFNIPYFPARYCGTAILKFEINSLYIAPLIYKLMWHNMLPIKPGTPGWTPSLFVNCTGFFYVHYTIHRTYGFTSHPKDASIMVQCLALGHKCYTTGTPTHTLLNRNTRTWVQSFVHATP